MIALQRHPGLARRRAVHQEADDARAFRPPVDQVAHMDDRRVSVARRRAVCRDQPVNALQQGKLAVNVADGVGAHASSDAKGAATGPRWPL